MSAPAASPSPPPPATPPPRKGVRARMSSMTGLVRRGSSFLTPIRPGTPSAARMSTEDFASSSNTTSVSSSPGKSGLFGRSSKPASIRSVDMNPPTLPLVAPEDQPVPQVRKNESVMLDKPVPVASVPVQAPEPAKEDAAAQVQPADAAAEPAAEPAPAPILAEESKPAEEPAPAAAPATEPEPESEASQEEPQAEPAPASAPQVAAHLSSTPESMSREPSLNGSAAPSEAAAAPMTSAQVTESPKSMPVQLLAVNTSRENLGLVHELSPIVEDERSALEAPSTFGQFPPPPSAAAPTRTAARAVAVPVVMAPPPAGAQAPALMSGVSAGASSGGPTPRAVPIALAPEVAPQKALEKALEARQERERAEQAEREPTLPEYTKGKERETNAPDYATAPNGSALPQEGYFASAPAETAPAPMPSAVPAIMTVPMIPIAQPFHQYELENPFKDPEPLPEESYVVMPQPDKRMPEPYQMPAAGEPFFPQAETDPINMPLPPLTQVTSPSGNLRNVPSDYTLAAHSSRAPSTHHEVETDETLPLLSRSKNAANGPGWTHHQPTFQSYGWEAYTLPDTTTYYAHAGKRVTTDIDLRDARKLAALTAYLDKKHSGDERAVREGLETWLHDEGVAGAAPGDFVLVRCWVDHHLRQLGYWPPPLPPHAEAEQRADGHEHARLEAEVKYWAFMETHPAHASLPANALSEAMDVLTWSYADRLLRSHRHTVPPFTQPESHELLEVLRSTSGTESPVQAAVQTKIVSRVLRRTAQWKLHTHHPEKSHHSRGAHVDFPPSLHLQAQRNVPQRKTFKDLLIAALCFGIPYLYANRHAYQHFDAEGGVFRSAGPMLVVSATVCIVAAVILTASVTFLALPGLDQVGRTAGLIATLASIASLVSSVVAAAWNSVEVQRLAIHGGEGRIVMMANVNDVSILPSLPAVFLGWSLVSFVTGIVLYVFRGSVHVDTSHWVRFASYTRWTTIGVCGFLGGMLLVSMFFIRH